MILWLYGGILALVGIALGYFLATIPIVILVTVGIVLLFLIMRGPHPAESGIASLFMAVAVLLIIVPMVVTFLAVGTPLLSFIYSTGQTTAEKFSETNWSWLIRR